MGALASMSGTMKNPVLVPSHDPRESVSSPLAHREHIQKKRGLGWGGRTAHAASDVDLVELGHSAVSTGGGHVPEGDVERVLSWCDQSDNDGGQYQNKGLDDKEGEGRR